MEKTGFGFFAPKAPAPQSMPTIDSELLLGDIIKVDGEQADSVPDPVGQFFQKAQLDAGLAKSSSTISDEQLTGLMCAPADARGPVALAKDASGDADWGWDTELAKRGSRAKERFREQLEEFFPNHKEEIAEICEVAAEVSALLAEAAA